MKLTQWEEKFIKNTSYWSSSSKKCFIVAILFIAAILMIFAWIFHLWLAERYKKFTFIYALAISITLAIIEFFLNTWITRYSIATKQLSAGNMAATSIISGTIVAACLSLTMFAPKILSSKFIGMEVGGYLFIAMGAGLLIANKKFE